VEFLIIWVAPKATAPPTIVETRLSALKNAIAKKKQKETLKSFIPTPFGKLRPDLTG